MRRIPWALPALLLVLLAPHLRAAEADLVGNWKLNLLVSPDRPTYWLLGFEVKDGKLTGSVLDVKERVPPATVEDLKLTGDKFTFSLKLDEGSFTFEGVVSKDAPKTIRGSLMLDQLVPSMLEATTWKKLDRFEITKEIVAAGRNDLRYFEAVMDLLGMAADNKAKPEDVRGWADKANKAAEAYGLRFQRDLALRTASALVNQEAFADISLTYARRAEKLLDPKESPLAQMRVLNVLITALKKNDKTEELKEVEAKLDKIDLAIPATKYAGRKEKSDRVLLLELFTGAECPPCVAVDLAFDALGKTYQPSEVVLLQYHLHIPRPDPLTNEDSETRSTYYGEAVEGTPTLLISGRLLPEQLAGGGGFDRAPQLYTGYTSILDQLLEKPNKVKLTASAVQKGTMIDVSADVAELEEPGAHIKLRFVLVEDEVGYSGGNQLRKHHHVVRGFPGGVNGSPVKTKEFKHTASIDVEELRKSLAKYLEDYAKANKDTPFPNAQRPIELKNLKVVAFLQNDKTKEVLQAVQVDIKK